MSNPNPKHTRQRERRRRLAEHRRRKLAEFEELARGWIPEEYRADLTQSVKDLAYFMMVDWLMTTGNVAEVNRFIDFMVTGLAKLGRLQEKDAANN
jgi:hypothetical protein